MDQQAAQLLTVEVALACRDKQRIVTIEIAAGSSLRDAVRASGIDALFPDIDVASAPLGVWGAARADDVPARAGDRIEIYRTLRNDPRALRMRLAAEGRTMGEHRGD